MAFSEDMKLTVKRRAHFACCLCHALGIELHHLIPQAEGGPDTEDNAAPLCPTCHETYGANPQKRKFIREARDFWYELCANRYAGDSSILNEIANRVEQSASKADLQAAVESITRLLSDEKTQTKPDEQELVSVELPIPYWVVVLGALAPQIKNITSQAEELHGLGLTTIEDVKKLPKEWVTIVAGVVFAQGAIVDALVEKGAMRPEAAKRGARALIETAKEFERRRKDT